MSESIARMQSCVERYQEAMDRVVAGLRPGDGILGFGNDPRRSPYHKDFYDEMGRLAGRLAALQGSPRLPAVRRRVLRALYYDYDFRDEFAPQLRQNLARLDALLDRLPG